MKGRDHSPRIPSGSAKESQGRTVRSPPALLPVAQRRHAHSDEQRELRLRGLGSTARDQIVECRQLEARVTFKVTSCSEYVDHQHPSLWHMEDIAWVLRTDARRHQIGFVRAKDLKIAERHVLDDDE